LALPTGCRSDSEEPGAESGEKERGEREIVDAGMRISVDAGKDCNPGEGKTFNVLCLSSGAVAEGSTFKVKAKQTWRNRCWILVGGSSFFNSFYL